jgi:hypothetical protein
MYGPAYLIGQNSQGLAPGPMMYKEREIFEIWQRISQNHIMEVFCSTIWYVLPNIEERYFHLK